MAPVTFALFTVAIAWPLQSALQKRIPGTAGARRHDRCDSRRPCDPDFLVVWGFGLVFQWVINNTDRIQTLYAQATEWLDSHGVSITNLVADSYNPDGSLARSGRSAAGATVLVSFIVIAFAFIVLGLLEVDHRAKECRTPEQLAPVGRFCSGCRRDSLRNFKNTWWCGPR